MTAPGLSVGGGCGVDKERWLEAQSGLGVSENLLKLAHSESGRNDSGATRLCDIHKSTVLSAVIM